MKIQIYVSLSLLSLTLCDYPLPHHSIRRVDHYPQHPHHLGHRLPHRPPVPARAVRHIPHLNNPLRGIFNLVESRRRSQRQPARVVKTQSHPRRPVSSKATQPRVVPNFIYLDAEQMPGYEKFEDHEIVRNGRTTESPYLKQNSQIRLNNIPGLIDERTSKTKISSEKESESETKSETETETETEERSDEESVKILYIYNQN